MDRNWKLLSLIAHLFKKVKLLLLLEVLYKFLNTL